MFPFFDIYRPYWHNQYPPPPPPIMPPYHAPVDTCGNCHKQPPAPVGTIAYATTTSYDSIMPIIASTSYNFIDYSFTLENKAPRAAYTAAITLAEYGYKIYIDGKACGAGAQTAQAYINLDVDGTKFVVSDKPSQSGISLPAFALIENQTLTTASHDWHGSRMTAVKFDEDQKKLVIVEITPRPGATLDQIAEILENDSTYALFNGTGRVNINGRARNDSVVSIIGDHPTDATRTLLGLPS